MVDEHGVLTGTALMLKREITRLSVSSENVITFLIKQQFLGEKRQQINKFNNVIINFSHLQHTTVLDNVQMKAWGWYTSPGSRHTPETSKAGYTRLDV